MFQALLELSFICIPIAVFDLAISIEKTVPEISFIVYRSILTFYMSFSSSCVLSFLEISFISASLHFQDPASMEFVILEVPFIHCSIFFS